MSDLLRPPPRRQKDRRRGAVHPRAGGLHQPLHRRALALEGLGDPGGQLAPGEGVVALEQLQIALHLPGAGIAVPGVLRQRGGADAVQRDGEPGDEEGGRRELLRLHRLDQGLRAVVGVAQGQKLVEHHARREDVRAVVELPAPRLLRRHVGKLALDLPGLGGVQAAGGLGDAEVDQLHLALKGDHHVVRADIPVDDLERAALVVRPVVRVVEARADLPQKEGGHGRRHRPFFAHQPAQHLVQADPLDVLHDDEAGLLRPDQVVDLTDVDVVQVGGDQGFVHHHVDERAAGVLLQHALDRHQLREPLVPRGAAQEDLGHPAAAETLQNFVFAQVARGLVHA